MAEGDLNGVGSALVHDHTHRCMVTTVYEAGIPPTNYTQYVCMACVYIQYAWPVYSYSMHGLCIHTVCMACVFIQYAWPVYSYSMHGLCIHTVGEGVYTYVLVCARVLCTDVLGRSLHNNA